MLVLSDGARSNSPHLASQGRSRVRQKARTTLLYSTFRMSCANTGHRRAPGIRALMPKEDPPSRFAHSTYHMRPVNNYAITLTVPSRTSWAPIPPHFSHIKGKTPTRYRVIVVNILTQVLSVWYDCASAWFPDKAISVSLKDVIPLCLDRHSAFPPLYRGARTCRYCP